MSTLKVLNSENFDEVTSAGVTLVDFWAPWCGPCKMLLPIMEQVAAELGSDATVAKVDIDECGDLAVRFGIRNVPAVFLIKDGEVLEQFNGIQTKAKLVDAVRNL